MKARTLIKQWLSSPVHRFIPVFLVVVLGFGALWWATNVPATRAQSDVIYVRPDGDDTLCDGETNAPYTDTIAPFCAVRTIGQGVFSVTVGGTVSVTAGTYTETVIIDKSLILQGAGTSDSVILGDNTGQGIYLSNHTAGVMIAALTVRNFEDGVVFGTFNDVVTDVVISDFAVVSNTRHGILSNAARLTNITFTRVNASYNGTGGAVGRGLFFESSDAIRNHVTIEEGVFSYNGLVGIDFNIGQANDVVITGNTVEHNGDAGIGVLGASRALIDGNIVTDNGRFGIEIKNPTGDGTLTGPNRFVVSGNVVSRTGPPVLDQRDHGGIVVIRRDVASGDGNPDIPSGVVVTGNIVSGFRQTISDHEGFGIVLEGTAMRAEDNELQNNDIGIQVQAGNIGYPGNSPTGGATTPQANSTYFDRGNAPESEAILQNNTYNNNTYGILVHGNSSAQLRGNAIDSTTTAIEISNDSITHILSVTVTNNFIFNATTGLSFTGTAPLEHVTVVGNRLTELFTVFGVSTAGDFHAYANNITNFTNGIVDPATALNARHNWWGTYSVPPAGVSGDNWDFRLGAPVDRWGMGTLDDAALTSAEGSGQGVIVSHGYGLGIAPFGQTTLPYGQAQCSDYYDFFVLDASGDWTVRIPVNTGLAGCDRDDLTLYHFALTGEGAPDTGCSGSACWLTPPGVSRAGDVLAVTLDAGTMLTGTPFVAGGGVADLVVSKTNYRTTVQPGETLAYLITVTNTGNIAATVSVTDTLPANTAFLVASNGGTQTAPDSGIVTWPDFTLAGSGASTTRLVVATLGTTLSAGVDVITNTVTVTSSNEVDASNNIAWDVDLVNAAPNLTLSKSDGDVNAIPGETLVYTLTYANAGNQGATGVVITETIPAHTTFAGPTGWSCGDTDCTYDLGALTAGGSGFITFTVSISTPLPANVTHINNTAVIADDGSNGADLIPANNIATTATPVEATPDLEISKSNGVDEVTPGDTLVYTLVITNTGDQDAARVTLTDNLPAHTTFITASNDGWLSAPGVVTWSDFALAGGGASATRVLTVTVDNPFPVAADHITNTATVADEGTTYATATDVDAIINAAPILALSKSNDVTTVTPGSTLIYRLVITNSGNQLAAGIVLTDTLPDYTAFVLASHDGVVEDGVVTWPAFDLSGGGASATRLLVVSVDTPLPAGVTTIANTAALRDNRGFSAIAVDVDDVNANPDFILIKTSAVTTTTPGATFSYTITLTNMGNQDATNVVLSDTLPADVSFAGASDGGYSATVSIVVWPPLPLLVSGASVTRVLTVSVNPTLPAGVEWLVNTASVVDDRGYTATTQHGTLVEATPDLVLTKRDGGVNATPGELLTYTLTFTNTGEQGATGVSLAETVPAYTSFEAAASHPGWQCAGATCTYSIGDLPATVTREVTFTVRVASPLPATVANIVNTASITDDGNNGDDPTPPNNATTITMTVDAAPQLIISKTNDVDAVRPGDTLSYRITLTNTGNLEATGIRITDTLPLSTTFIAASDGGGLSAPGIVVWPPFNLPGGGASVTRLVVVTVDSPLPAGVGAITNTASAIAPGQTLLTTTRDIDAVIAAPDLALSKRAAAASVEPGDALVYTLTYANRGNQDATGVVITETIPAHTSFDPAASAPGWNCASAPCTYDVGSLPAGTTHSITFTVNISPTLPTGITQIVNSAGIADDGANGADSDPTNNVDSTVTSVIAAPDLRLSKSDGGVTTMPGATLVYTLSYANVGTQEATGVTITETVPLHTEFAGAVGWSCPDTSAGTLCTYDAGDLAAGGSGEVQFIVNVITPVPAGVTLIHNTASIVDDGSNGADPTPANNTTTIAIPVEAAPDLEISKSNGVVGVEPGDTLVYTLTITNSGSQGATGIRITDYLPAHTTFVVASDGGGLYAPGLVTWPLFDLPGGGASVTRWLTVTVANPFPVDTNVITNTATVADDGTNGSDPTPENNSAEDVDTVFAAPSLGLSKSNAVSTVTPGSTLIYRLVITNSGTQLAAGIVLTDTLPEHTFFYLASDNGSESAPGIVTWPTFNLPGGASTTRLLVVTVNNPLPAGVTAITNNAALRDNRDNTATAQDIDAVDANPLLVLDKTNAVDAVVPGETIVYTLTLTNNGNQEATGIRITDTLPADVTFVGASDGGIEIEPGIVAWPTFNLVGGGTSVTRYLTVRVNSTLPAGLELLINTAQVSEDRGYTAMAQHADLVIAAPDLEISKSNGVAGVEPGDTLVYTLTITNSGSQGAIGIRITDYLPAHTTFVAASDGGGLYAPGLVTWPLFDLPGGGASVTRWLTVTVANPFPVDTNVITNTATVADDGTNGPDPTPENNSAEDVDTVFAAPSLGLSKSNAVSTVTPGSTLIYRLVITNSGTQLAAGIVLTDTLPEHTFFYLASDNGSESAPGIVTWPTFDLPGGASTTRLLVVTVDNPLPAGVTAITNNAALRDNRDNTATAQDTDAVDANPLLVLDKTNAVDAVVPGETIVYTLTLTNNGNQEATGIRITDTLPADVTFVAASDGGIEIEPGIVGWPTFNLAGGGASVTRYLTVRVNPTLPAGLELLINTAQASEDRGYIALAQHADLVVAAPDLAISKTDDGLSPRPGDVLVYTLTYANVGEQDATGVVIAETVPAYATFVATASSPGWTCADGAPAGTACTYTVGDLPAGDSDDITFAVGVADPLPVYVRDTANTASITDDGSNGADTDPENNIVSIITPFDATLDLFITKEDGGITAEPGETIVYTLTYGNYGDQIAGDVVITETVPALTSFNQMASSSGWSCVHGAPAGTICTYPLGDVIEGGTLRFAVDVVLPFPLNVNEITNQVNIGADANNIPDANPVDNTATTITPIITRPDLVIGKDDGFSVVLPDQRVTYVITVTNVGTQNSTNVQIVDTLPGHVAFAGASDGGMLSAPGIVTWPTIPQITLDEVVTRTLSVIVNATLPAGVTHITNTVTVSDDGTHGPDMNPDDNTAIDVNFVGAMPDLVLYKTVDRATVHPTGLLVYTIRVENVGSQGATGIGIVDTLPAGTSFVSASNDGDVSAPGIVTWPAFTLHVGEQATRTLTVQTASGLPEDYVLTNTATVSDDGANGEDPTPENNTNTATSIIKWPFVYLPLVLRSYAIGPDLIVDGINFGNGNIAITIRNQGKLAVPDALGFWVDLYINPSPVPTRVNQTWDTLAPYGAAWAVDREALSGLLPGQSYTLYLFDKFYQYKYSRLPTELRLGDVIYVQVDSYYAATNYGVVLEDHEMGGWEYNNIERKIVDNFTPLNPLTSMQSVPESSGAGPIPERP